MKEDTIRMVKGVQDTCSEMLADVVGNFNSGIALARSEFEAIMRAEREERIQDQALQHSNSEILQGRCDRHREDINELFVKYRKVRDQGNVRATLCQGHSTPTLSACSGLVVGH